MGCCTDCSLGEKKGSAVKDMHDVIETSRISGHESYLAASFSCSRAHACRYSGLQNRPTLRFLLLCTAVIGGPPNFIVQAGALNPPQMRSRTASGFSGCAAL